METIFVSVCISWGEYEFLSYGQEGGSSYVALDLRKCSYVADDQQFPLHSSCGALERPSTCPGSERAGEELRL